MNDFNRSDSGMFVLVFLAVILLISGGVVFHIRQTRVLQEQLAKERARAEAAMREAEAERETISEDMFTVATAAALDLKGSANAEEDERGEVSMVRSAW